jgi:hypothetical protein
MNHMRIAYPELQKQAQATGNATDSAFRKQSFGIESEKTVKGEDNL